MRLACVYVLRRMVFQQPKNGLFTWNFLCKTYQNSFFLYLLAQTYQSSTKTFHNSTKSHRTQINTSKTCIQGRFRFKYNHTPLLTFNTNLQQLEITLEVIQNLPQQHLRNSNKVQSSSLAYKLLKPLEQKQENMSSSSKTSSVFWLEKLLETTSKTHLFKSKTCLMII